MRRTARTCAGSLSCIFGRLLASFAATYDERRLLCETLQLGQGSGSCRYACAAMTPRQVKP
jgi:hypothetical protein